MTVEAIYSGQCGLWLVNCTVVSGKNLFLCLLVEVCIIKSRLNTECPGWIMNVYGKITSMDVVLLSMTGFAAAGFPWCDDRG